MSKESKNIIQKRYYLNNKEKVYQYHKEYNLKNKELIKLKGRKRYLKLKNDGFFEINREKIRKNNKIYRGNNKEKVQFWRLQNKHKRKESKRRIMEWYEQFKKTLKCERCGMSDYRCLEFHHLKDKSYLISYRVRRLTNFEHAKSEVLNEAKKCIVLCSNCHKIIHYEDRDKFKELSK